MAMGGYTQALLVAEARQLLFISGQTPVARDGSVPEGFREQCRLAWANVMAQLTAAEMDVSDLVKITTFLADRNYADENRSVRTAVLGAHRAALTVVIADIFDSRWLIEIEAIAAK